MDAEDRKMSSRLLVATETGNWKGVYAILHQGIQSDNCIGMVSIQFAYYCDTNNPYRGDIRHYTMPPTAAI